MKRTGFIFVMIGMMGIILPFWALAQAAENNTTTLQAIVVSAPRVDKNLLETTASITVITAEQIAEMGAKNIVDIVTDIPGIVKDSDSRDRLTFRGNRSPQSFGVLVLVDGVPANGGISGYSEYDAIPISNIDRVEVLRSSGSIAFGPDAARGMINIITKKGEPEAPQIKAGASYGSWSTRKASASIIGGTEKWDYAANAAFMDTDGYENDNKQRGAARVGAGFTPSDSTRIGMNVSWRKVDYDTIYGKTQWQVEHFRQDKIFPTSETNDTLVHHRENEDENTAVDLQFNTRMANAFANGFVSYDQTDHVYKYLPKRLDPTYNKASSYYDYQEDSDQDRYLTRISGGYDYKGERLTYTPILGIDYENTSFDNKKDYPWSPTPLSSSQSTAVAKGTIDTERKRWGIFLNNELGFAENWNLTLGGRFDQVDYEVKSKLPEKVTNDHSDFSWTIIPAFYPVPDATVYVSVSRSNWYPVLQYYKYAMEYGDEENSPEDLTAEEYFTYEIGYKHEFGSKLSLALTLYAMTVENKFLSLYDESTWLGYRNIGKSKHQGIELEAAGRLNAILGYRLSGAYQDAQWEDAIFRAYVWGATPADDERENVDISDEKVPHVPALTTTMGLDFYFTDHFKFSTDLNYYSKQYVDVLNRYEIDDYFTTDAKLSYKRNNYKIWLTANNLLDIEVENKFNETGQRNADGTPNHLYYPLDGRYLEIGATIEF